MTIEEAKANIGRLVRGVSPDGVVFDGEIKTIYEDQGLVRVIVGEGLDAQFYVILPSKLKFVTQNVVSESNYVGYNLNDPVLVKLDDRAFEIWKRHDDSGLDFASDQIRARLIKPLEQYKSRANADGYVEMQFNELMCIFGYYCRIGYEVFDMNVLLPKNKIDEL